MRRGLSAQDFVHPAGGKAPSAVASRPSASTPRTLTPATLTLLSLPILLGAFFLSLHGMRDWVDSLRAASRQSAAVWQYGALALFCAFSIQNFLTARVKLSPYTYLPIAFGFYMVINSAYSVSRADSFLFSIGFSAFFVGCMGIWLNEAETRRRTYALAALALLGAIAYLFATMPWTARSVGSIPPNQFSHAAIVVACLALMSRSRFKYFVIAAALILLAHTNSRTAMIQAIILVLALGAFYARRAKLAHVLAIVVGAIGLVSIVGLFPNLISDAFSLNDAARGIDSGFTGRTEHWAKTALIVSGHEIGGLGIQTRQSASEAFSIFDSAHSGFLNAYIEVGIIGITIYLALIIAGGVIWFVRALHGGPETRLAFCYILSMLPVLMMQPTYLSAWQPTQVLFWFFVAGAFIRAENAPRKNRTALGGDATRPADCRRLD